MTLCVLGTDSKVRWPEFANRNIHKVTVASQKSQAGILYAGDTQTVTNIHGFCALPSVSDSRLVIPCGHLT